MFLNLCKHVLDTGSIDAIMYYPACSSSDLPHSCKNKALFHCEEKSSPLFTGGGVDVHALGTGQALGLSLQAIGG